jgi:hypothetical protein
MVAGDDSSPTSATHASIPFRWLLNFVPFITRYQVIETALLERLSLSNLEPVAVHPASPMEIVWLPRYGRTYVVWPQHENNLQQV